MHESGHRRMRIFAHWIAHFPRSGGGFLNARNDLTANGTIFICRINQVEKIRRDAERELGVRKLRACQFFGRQRGEKIFQLFDRRDAVLHLPAPVRPIRLGNVMPETAPHRAKRFEGWIRGAQRRGAGARGWIFSLHFQ